MDVKHKRAHDIDLFVRLAYSQFSVGYIPEPLYKVDISTHNSLTRMKNRYQKALSKLSTIRNHVPTAKGSLYLRCCINETLKSIYGLFSQKRDYFWRWYILSELNRQFIIPLQQSLSRVVLPSLTCPYFLCQTIARKMENLLIFLHVQALERYPFLT